jgi:hypothetical protein
MARRIGYGVVIWALPYVTSVALMDLMTRDRAAFTTIMIVEGSVVGTWLAGQYFRTVPGNFLREGIALGATWIVVNWTLDFVALMPFANLTLSRYFVEIGLRYVPIAATTVGFGYVLTTRTARSGASAQTAKAA